MKQLKVQSFGPLEKVEVNFGDLTLLVGPQASGKSIFLQLLKLIIDKDFITRTLHQYNYVWDKNPKNILDIYFGEGMASVWKSSSKIQFDNNNYEKDYLLRKPEYSPEMLLYIPAQRILSISDGRPKNFMEFDAATPYVLRQFSETLRLYIQNEMGQTTSVFPLNHKLETQIRQAFNNNIFHGGKVVMDERTGQKKLRLEAEDLSVPFMTWSAGQKEFMPLLMAFYCLSDTQSKIIKKDKYDYVVMEEPEMGLHPQAIKSIILQTIDLLARNYKVIISTHSPVFLEFAWVFNLLKKQEYGSKALFELFDLKKSNSVEKLFNVFINKTINTFYFSRKNDMVVSKDITSLDAGSEDVDIAEWGGISSFAGKASDIFSKYFLDEN